MYSFQISAARVHGYVLRTIYFLHKTNIDLWFEYYKKYRNKVLFISV